VVSVFTSREQRVYSTLDYMKKKCSSSLLALVAPRLKDNTVKKNAGSYIKLDLGRDSDSRRALRSLLLCQYLLVEARDDSKMTQWGKACFGSARDTRDHWKGKSEREILNGVAGYDASGSRCLADALEGLGRDPGDDDFQFNKMTRDTKNLGAKEGICYQTVSLALWLGGRASIAWLSNWYAQLNAGNCFTVLGAGTEVQNVTQVLPLRGTVISFRAKQVKGPQTVNHWAVVVSDGCAVGSNTDGFRDFGSTGVGYEFKWGKRRFGKFDILECLAACKANTKYRDSGGVRIATHRVGDMQLW